MAVSKIKESKNEKATTALVHAEETAKVQLLPSLFGAITTVYFLDSIFTHSRVAACTRQLSFL